MASLVSTIPRYLRLILKIYLLRSLLLALSAVDWVIEIASCFLSAFTRSILEQSSHDYPSSQHALQPDNAEESAADIEDYEESICDSECGSVAFELDSDKSYPCESTTYLIEDSDAVATIGRDLEFLIGALVEGIQSFANEERFLVQSTDVDSGVGSSNSNISLLASLSAPGPDINGYSAIMRPHTPKRFSLRVDNVSMTFWKIPNFDTGAKFNTTGSDSGIGGPLSPMPLSQRPWPTPVAWNTNTSTANDAEDISLSPALLWTPNLTKVKVVLALPLKRTRRRKASSVVIWSNEGEYGDLKKALEEVGR